MMPVFHSRKTELRSGYILLEVLLALGIFSIAVVALAVALNDTISAAVQLQKETKMVWNLESRLNQARLKRFIIGTQKLEPEAGVSYEQEITQVDLKNEKNQTLNNLYNVKITAKWTEQNVEEVRTAQIYVYQP